MWTCPTCGRSFKNTNQNHTCRQPQSVDEYISMQPEDHQPRLIRLRQIIAQAIPQAQEKIAWQMPTFRHGKNLIHFADAKNHIGLFPGDKAVAAFAPQLEGWDFSKGTIRLPYAKDLPEALIADIARWCWENRE